MSYFIGLPLTSEAQRGVESVATLLSRKHWQVAWVRPEDWHATIVFLGSEHTLRSLTRLIRTQQGSGRFSLGLKGLGQFPRQNTNREVKERIHGRNLRYVSGHSEVGLILPRIIYISLKGNLHALHRLKSRLRTQLSELEVLDDDKVLVPHITIARVLKTASYGQRLQMAQEIEKLRRMDIPQQWEVRRVCLYESVRDREASSYNVVEEVGLR